MQGSTQVDPEKLEETKFRALLKSNTFLSTLLGTTARNAFAPAAVASPLAIIPEKVIQQNRKAKGRFGCTGTVSFR